MVTKAISLGATLVAGLLAVTPAAAQTVMMKCVHQGGGESWMLTIDLTARTLSADWLNNGVVGKSAFQQLPAEISGETITATWRNVAGGDWRHFVLNRNSGVLSVTTWSGVMNPVQYTRCERT